MKRIAIFASGGGTNMEAIMEYLAGQTAEDTPRVACVISDHSDAYVLQRAKNWGLPSYYLTSKQLQDPSYLLPLLENHQVDAIVLAGYLRLIPPFLLQAYPHKIINIHPALLPKYGGKGMYGMNVHRAVKEAGEKETGITIHLIDEEYDRGTILFQAATPIEESDDADTIAHKVQKLEHQYYPKVIVNWLTTP